MKKPFVEKNTFNLALAKAGNPIRTRDGRSARVVVWDLKNPYYPLGVLIATRDPKTGRDYEHFQEFKEDGTICGVSLLDLFMV